jgi:hypothetical protein
MEMIFLLMGCFSLALVVGAGFVHVEACKMHVDVVDSMSNPNDRAKWQRGWFYRYSKACWH